MTDSPRPIDTASIQLPPTPTDPTEQLAENSAAPEATRDESERVAELERHLVAQAADSSRYTRGDFDMDDGPDASALAPFPELAETLRWLAEHVARPWREADAAALRLQTRHGHLARIAIASGTSAVIMAVLQLALKLSWPGLSGTALAIEVAAAAAGAVAVGVGLRVRWNTKWLAHRQLAERLRILKFRALGRLDLLSVSAAAWRDWLEQELAQLRAPQTTDGLREWASSDTPEFERPLPSAGFGDPATSAALAAYYTHKRLVYQAEYFTRKAEIATARSAWHHRLRFPLFIVTIVCVIVHVGADLLGGSHGSEGVADGARGWHLVSLWGVALAAMIPVFGIGVRTWSGAFEHARRARTFPAKARALRRAADLLDRDRSNPSAVAERIRHDELFLEQEHREWLRLLLDAEWYW